MNQIAVIMAGGSGERFWPMSRSNKPKQFLKLVSKSSMIRESFLRLKTFLPIENIFIVTGDKFYHNILEEVPELNKDNIIIEPFARDTAAAIGLSISYIDKKFSNSVVLVCPSDHMIADHSKFISTIVNGFNTAYNNSCIVILGINPSKPETAYGYIELGELFNNLNDVGIYKVKRFVEKPDYNTATQYIKAKRFLWNSGMFIFKTDSMLAEMNKHMPALAEGVKEINSAIGSHNEDQVKHRVFSRVDKLSIDYGIMEKTNNILCIKSSFDWDDVGSWTSINRWIPSNEDGNIALGQVISHNTKDSIIIGDNKSMVAVVGMRDVIVVKGDNGFLVCAKNSDQDIKKVLAKLKQNESFDNFL